MSFDQRFHVLGTIPDTIGLADHAMPGRQISSGRLVTIHLLAGGHNPANEDLLAQVAALPHDYQACFLETGDHRGTPYVITDVLAGNPPLRQWMAGLKAKLVSGDPSNPNDPNRMKAWKIPGWAVGQPPAGPGGAAPSTGPGEFTRLFQTLPKPSADPASSAPSASAGEGEFTRLLKPQVIPPAPAATPPAPPAPAATEPGEFTRLLRIPSQSPARPPAPPVSPTRPMSSRSY